MFLPITKLMLIGLNNRRCTKVDTDTINIKYNLCEKHFWGKQYEMVLKRT